MPLPPDVDKRIRERFEELVQEGERLIPLSIEHHNKDVWKMLEPTDYPFEREFYALHTNTLSLLQILVTKQNHIGKVIDDVRKLGSSQLDRLLGIIKGLKSDYEMGLMVSLSQMVEANMIGDYLAQAQGLLTEGKTEANFGHIPAAVLAGSIFEDALRRLAQRQTPPISLSKPGGKPKMMNSLIDELKDAGLYNELKAKQLRAWADIRNSAAHGQFTEFSRADVEQMLTGIQNFLADYM